MFQGLDLEAQWTFPASLQCVFPHQRVYPTHERLLSCGVRLESVSEVCKRQLWQHVMQCWRCWVDSLFGGLSQKFGLGISPMTTKANQGQGVNISCCQIISFVSPYPAKLARICLLTNMKGC